ncbi:MAG: acyltransferase [Pseudomonadota bacterium]
MRPILSSPQAPVAPLSGLGLGRTQRLLEVDALRGLAAMAVVLFHYTTRFTELFPASGTPSLATPAGHYGVNLFFVISGFVIFMTLERTRRPRDFWLSRLGRLFPSYWVAIFATFTLCHLLGLPGKLVGWDTAVANMVMLHGLFGVAHVDGVYWTLEVEMLFYCGMFLLYRLRWMDHIHWCVGALLLLRLAHFGAEQRWGMALPWTLVRLLILQYLPWFALGLAVFLAVHRTQAAQRHGAAGMAGLAVATLGICESAGMAALAVVFASAVYLAVRKQLAFLRAEPLVWLGAISYPLYLLHENIGWAIQLRLVSLRMPLDLALVVALAVSLLLADLCTRWVEQPAMRWARRLRQRGLH